MHNNGTNKPFRNRNPKIILQEIVFKEKFISRVQRFPGLENARTKFQDFPRFPGHVRTLWCV